MENNITKKQNAFISEEEKTINWEEVQTSFKKTFGAEIYNSWLQKMSYVAGYNSDYATMIPIRINDDRFKHLIRKIDIQGV